MFLSKKFLLLLFTYSLIIFFFITAGSQVKAHSENTSFEKEVNGYLIDIGYTPLQLEVRKPVQLDFDLYSASDSTQAVYTHVWVKIANPENTIFTAGISRARLGKTVLNFIPPYAGLYELSVRFHRNDLPLVESTFPLTITNPPVSFNVKPKVIKLLVLTIVIFLTLFLLLKKKILSSQNNPVPRSKFHQTAKLLGKSSKIKLKILIILLLVVTVETAILVNSTNPLQLGNYDTSKQTQRYVVELGKNGFSPQVLLVEPDTKVSFASSRGEEFWPASDPHPVHTTYAEFDANSPVKPGDSWSFVFTKAGDWPYHDHLQPSFRGTIKVVADSDQYQNQAKDCASIGNADERSQCWNESIKSELKFGLAAGFAKFAQIYAQDEDFVSKGCHWTAHLIGEEAYRLFSESTVFDLTPATAYCGFGFYHGFMAKLLNDNPDLSRAREFCAYVDTQLKDKTPIARINCYHGIGHGYIEDPPDPRTWGNPDAMLKEALNICETVSEQEIEIKECSEGAYNQVVLFMEAEKYGLKLDRNNLLSFCRTQPKKFYEYCLYEIAQKLDGVSGWDVEKAAQIADTVEENELAKMVIGVATAAMIQRDVIKDDNSDYVYKCRQIPPRLRDTCLGGVIGGYFAHGEPEKEYLKALKFCAIPIMTELERIICYDTAFNRLKNMYTMTKSSEICRSLPNRYRQMCDEKIQAGNT